MKQQTIIKLAGTFINNEGRQVAKTHQSDLVSGFIGSTLDNPEYFTINLCENEKVILLNTPKGEYVLHLDPAGYYSAEINGIKVHITLKKISGKLIFWA
jgi:hypothetical protein